MPIEYQVFGKSYSCDRAAFFSMRQIRDERLRELYKIFKICIDNVHTDLDSVKVHFLEDNDRVDLLWTCDHFEGNHSLDLIGLLYFFAEVKNFFGDVEIVIDLLDGKAEKLIIKICDVPFQFPTKPSNIKFTGDRFD
jgi:hypothetical protein